MIEQPYFLLAIFFLLWIFVPFLPAYLAYKFLPGEVKFDATNKIGINQVSINATGGIAIYVLFLYLSYSFFFSKRLDNILESQEQFQKKEIELKLAIQKEKSYRNLNENTECTSDVLGKIKVKLLDGTYVPVASDLIRDGLKVSFEPSRVNLQGSKCSFKLYSSVVENKLGTIVISSQATRTYSRPIQEFLKNAKVDGSDIDVGEIELEQIPPVLARK